jgi:hypothetical protein
MLFINRLFLSRVGKYELAAAMSGGLSNLVPSSFPCSPGYRVCIDAARGLHLCCCESHLVGGGYRAMDGKSVARSIRGPGCLSLCTIFGTLGSITPLTRAVTERAYQGHHLLPQQRVERGRYDLKDLRNRRHQPASPGPEPTAAGREIWSYAVSPIPQTMQLGEPGGLAFAGT